MVDYHLGKQINGRPTLRDAYKKSSNRGLRRDKEDTLGSRESSLYLQEHYKLTTWAHAYG